MAIHIEIAKLIYYFLHYERLHYSDFQASFLMSLICILC